MLLYIVYSYHGRIVNQNVVFCNILSKDRSNKHRPLHSLPLREGGGPSERWWRERNLSDKWCVEGTGPYTKSIVGEAFRLPRAGQPRPYGLCERLDTGHRGRRPLHTLPCLPCARGGAEKRGGGVVPYSIGRRHHTSSLLPFTYYFSWRTVREAGPYNFADEHSSPLRSPDKKVKRQ